MESAFLTGILINPFVLALFLLAVAGITSIHYRQCRHSPVIKVRRLLPAYACALVACALGSVVMSYVSPEEAMLKWKVPPENYWNAQLNEFVSTFAFAAYASLLGIAAIGIPVIFGLARRGFATAPAVLVAAAAISMLFAALMAAGSASPLRHFLALACELVFGHVLVAAGFCVGAGLPWLSSRDVRRT
jgi:hypothetical protein